MNNSDIKYSGKVTIKIKNKNKVLKTIKVHNTGTPWLFHAIASALTAGLSETPFSNNMPRYLLCKESSGTTYTKVSPYFIFTSATINEVQEGTTVGWSTTFTCSIPKRSILPGTTIIDRLEMYSSSSSENYKLAYLDLIEPEEGHEEDDPRIIVNNIPDGGVIYIEWTMSLTNVETEESEEVSD